MLKLNFVYAKFVESLRVEIFIQTQKEKKSAKLMINAVLKD